jgi:acetolactate synthase-1/3 small subunit
VAEVFKADVLDIGHESITLEITGASETLDDFLELVSPYGLVEVARSGLVSMERARKSAAVKNGKNGD